MAKGPWLGGSPAAHAARVARAREAVRADVGGAWLLDAPAFHTEFDELFAGLGDGDEALDRFWARALRVIGDRRPFVQRYVATLSLHSPEEWAAGFEEAHLAEWYRLLMARHLEPTIALSSPTAVRQRLPDLGWSPADARRVAFGRELMGLAQTYADPDCAAALATVLPLGNKGWLSQDDITEFLKALLALDPDVFRGLQNLVPLVEEVHLVLSEASRSDRVLILAPS